MAITPGAGYQVDPSNPNGVIKIGGAAAPGVGSSSPAAPGTYNAIVPGSQSVDTSGNSTALPPSPSVPSISSSALSPSSTLNYQTPAQTPLPNVAGLSAITPLAPTQPEQKASDLSQRLQALNDSLSGKNAYESDLYKQYGFGTTTDANGNVVADPGTADLSAKLTQLQNDAQAIPLQLQTDFTGRASVSQIQGQTQAALRNNAVAALGVSSLIAAKNGQLVTAQHLVDQAVNQKYGPQEAQLKAGLANLQLIINSPDYTLAEKNRAAAQTDALNQRAAALDIAKQNALSAQTEMLKYAPVATAQQLSEMQQAQSPADVAQIAAKYGLQQPQTGRYKDTITTTTDAFGNQNQTVRVFDTLTGKFVDAPSGTTADQLNQSSGGAPTGTYGTATSTVSRITGISPSTPLSQADPLTLAKALVQNEGGSPKGVSNNPGNVKFTGASGQTDSGVKATDGGTFANYATPAAGQQAIADIIKKAQSGNSVYGPTPTVGSFVDKYTNTAPQSKNFDQYGLLTQTDFSPSDTHDQLAQLYLDQYLKNGVVPTASSLGRGIKPAAAAQVAQRARDIYYQATGNPLPNPEVIKGYQKIVNANNNFTNNLKTQESTVHANFGLSLENLKANDLNTSGINSLNLFLDNVKQFWQGNPEAAQYALQNATVSNEIGSLLAVRNAGGTTVHDKLEAAGLVPKGASLAQQKAMLQTLLTEAANAKQSLAAANGDLYKQIDPLLQDPNNPLRGAYQAAQSNPLIVVDPNGTSHTFSSAAQAAAFKQAAGIK